MLYAGINLIQLNGLINWLLQQVYNGFKPNEFNELNLHELPISRLTLHFKSITYNWAFSALLLKKLSQICFQAIIGIFTILWDVNSGVLSAAIFLLKPWFSCLFYAYGCSWIAEPPRDPGTPGDIQLEINDRSTVINSTHLPLFCLRLWVFYNITTTIWQQVKKSRRPLRDPMEPWGRPQKLSFSPLSFYNVWNAIEKSHLVLNDRPFLIYCFSSNLHSQNRFLLGILQQPYLLWIFDHIHLDTLSHRHSNQIHGNSLQLDTLQSGVCRIGAEIREKNEFE